MTQITLAMVDQKDSKGFSTLNLAPITKEHIMATTDKDDAGIQYFLDEAKRQGVAIRTVTDGKVLVLNTDWLRNLLEQHADQENVLIFLKQPTFDN
jgi:hypothetical protein